MDLGCLDICCLTDSDKHVVVDSSVGESTPQEISASSGKTKMTKESGQSTTSVNKFTSQIKKPPHRKASPLNWFPRKKVASYLERKIRMLQEVDGMNSSLDETLGDANPHYSRVLREKMAAKEAAHRAMEARKAAMVEASWCRILKAARIDTKEAESLLKIAENNAAEAFEVATALGVVMFDAPYCPQKRPRIHTSSADANGPTTHTVTASFKTAFKVDREVAAAVKGAFTWLATHQSFSKDEFKDLMQRISQTPETGYTSNEILEFSSGCESESGSEIEKPSQDSARSLLRLKKFKKRPSPEKLMTVKLEDMMVERLQRLHEDELSSLATIVATCGLNAALAEVENKKLLDSGSNDLSFSRRMSLSESASVKSNLECYQTGKPRRSQESELPSFDKYLVKHMTKLEKEVEKAKSLRSGSTDIETDRVDSEKSLEVKAEKPDEASGSDLASVLVQHSSKLEKEIEEFKRSQGRDYEMNTMEKEVEKAKSLRSGSTDIETDRVDSEKSLEVKVEKPDEASGSDLASVLVKHSSKLEKEIEEFKRSQGRDYEMNTVGRKDGHNSETPFPSLDKFLVKHVSLLEKEVAEAKNRRMAATDKGLGNVKLMRKENRCSFEAGREGTDQEVLGNILVKPIHRLEREKMEQLKSPGEYAYVKQNEKPSTVVGRKDGHNSETPLPSLDKFLVKHVSLLEKEVEEAKNRRMAETDKGLGNVKLMGKENRCSFEADREGLGNILVKPVHRLEREKMEQLKSPGEYAYAKQNEKPSTDSTVNCESLDKVLVRHVSRLERDKMRSSLKEEFIPKAKGGKTNVDSQGSLEQILVKHTPRLQREKILAAALQSEQEQGQARVTETRREARERELREAWGGISLGNSVKPHLSRLEREKAAWIKAAEEERKKASMMGS